MRRGGFKLAMGVKVRLIGPAPKRRLQWQGLTRGWLRNCIGMASCAGAEEPWGEEISRWEEDRMLIQLSGSESGALSRPRRESHLFWALGASPVSAFLHSMVLGSILAMEYGAYNHEYGSGFRAKHPRNP